MKNVFVNSLIIFASTVVLAGPAAAQTAPIDPGKRLAEADSQTGNDAQTQPKNQGEGLQQQARTADTGIGEVGQRQTKRDSAVMATPLDRISNRINNRVQNRLRNRIDRTYDPTANATSPFKQADEQARTAPRG